MLAARKKRGPDRFWELLIPEILMQKFYFDVHVKKTVRIFDFEFWPIYDADEFLYFNGFQGYAQFVHMDGTVYLVIEKQEARHMWE